MNCHRCDSPVESGDRFCPSCGTDITPSVPAAPTPSAPIWDAPTVPSSSPTPTPPVSTAPRVPTSSPTPPLTAQQPSQPSWIPATPTPTSNRGIPTAIFIAMVAVFVLGVGGAVAWALLGSDDEAAAPATTLSTVPRTTAVPAPTTPTTTLDDRLREARSDWEELQATLPTDLTPTRAALVDDRPMATTVDTVTGELAIWEYNDEGEWFRADSLMLSFGNELPYIDDIKFLDLTDDGSAEIWVEYFPGNDTVGSVFRHENEQWELVASGTGLTPGSDGSTQLRGTENSCKPDCAAGNYYPYTYTWNGSAFKFQAYDNVGNPAYFEVTTDCPKPYNANDSLPLRRCDKGEKVRRLQAALAAEGFLWSDEVDGFFGPGTETAVRYYQLAHYLEVNGVVDSWYWDLVQG